MNDEVIIICRMCGNIFERETPKQAYCSERCRRIARKASYLRHVQRKKEQERRLKDPLDKTLRELDEYNAKNGTSLSYGQYQVMKGRKQ